MVTGLDTANEVDSINRSSLPKILLQDIEDLRLLKGGDDEVDGDIQNLNTVKTMKVILPVL